MERYLYQPSRKSVCCIKKSKRSKCTQYGAFIYVKFSVLRNKQGKKIRYRKSEISNVHVMNGNRQSKLCTGPQGSRKLRLPEFQDDRHTKVARLSGLCTGRLYPPGKKPGTHFCKRLSRSQGHSRVGRIKSMNNSSDTIGNRTRDLQACSQVPQPTAPRSTPRYEWKNIKYYMS